MDAMGFIPCAAIHPYEAVDVIAAISKLNTPGTDGKNKYGIQHI